MLVRLDAPEGKTRSLPVDGGVSQFAARDQLAPAVPSQVLVVGTRRISRVSSPNCC